MEKLVAYWIPKNQIVILNKTTLFTEVEFDFNIKYLQAELGPESDFEIIGYFEHQYEEMEYLTISIKDFVNGSTDQSMAMKIVVNGLSKKQLKNKGDTVVTVGNYIYNRFGLIYEMCPEYSNAGEQKDSLTWFVSQARFKRQERLINFIAAKENKSANLVKLGAVTYNIVIKPEGVI